MASATLEHDTSASGAAVTFLDLLEDMRQVETDAERRAMLKQTQDSVRAAMHANPQLGEILNQITRGDRVRTNVMKMNNDMRAQLTTILLLSQCSNPPFVHRGLASFTAPLNAFLIASEPWCIHNSAHGKTVGNATAE